MRRPGLRWVLVLFVALIAGLLWAAIAALRPLPERSLTMATGPAGSAYAVFGERYRAILARQGVTLRLVATAGSFDNAARLRDPHSGVSAGFVQSGTTSAEESPQLQSLGSVFYEPLWYFCRCEPRGLAFHEGLGSHLSIGPAGSASRALALRLMQLNGIDPGRLRLEGYPPEEAADALLHGQLDAAIISTAWDSPAVRKLLADPSIGIAGFPRADAYVALLPFLSKIVLPMGVANLAQNRPPQDVLLIAPKANLVVRGDLHPALQYLLIDAAQRIHGGPGVFNAAGAFPAAEAYDLPLSEEAHQMYRSGPGFLRRHLPFWLAELVQRLLLIAIPLVGLLYPIVRFVPQAWRWHRERRIYRMYRELGRLESELRSRPSESRRAELMAQLDELAHRAAQLRLPDSFSAMCYDLKSNIQFVSDRAAAPASRS